VEVGDTFAQVAPHELGAPLGAKLLAALILAAGAQDGEVLRVADGGVSMRRRLPALSYIFTELPFTQCLTRTPSGRSL
jgi:hypothetical protein